MAVASFGGDAVSSLQNILRNAVGNADSAVSASQSGVTAAQSGLGAVLGGKGVVDNAVTQMNTQADAALSNASDAKATFQKLGPLATLLGQYGDSLWGEGNDLGDRAKTLWGQGDAILNMDPNADGLAGEFMRYWRSLSPDRYVSQAASDVTSAYNNAMGQAERDLARRGVSATSGAYGALKRQFSNLMATAVAAAKTKARQNGLDAQAAQLDKMLNASATLENLGSQMESQSLSAKGQAMNAQNAAAGIRGQEAQGYVQVGGLQLNAGQLFGSAAQLNNSYLTLVNQAYGNVTGAYNQLANTNTSAANIKLNAAGTEVSVNTGHGGGGGGGSVSRSPSSSKETNEPTGAWVALNKGMASQKFGTEWAWDPNASAEE